MSDAKNPGVATEQGIKPYVPHIPNAPYISHATITIDTTSPSTPLKPIWASLGFDEINWACMPRGKALLHNIRASSPHPYYVRPHNVFTSGTGFGLPHWGGGNVYHEDGDGNPYLDFSIVDQAYDAIVGAGHHLIVELGFTPRDLVPDAAKHIDLIQSPSLYSAYEAFQWSHPPKDLTKWAFLVSGLVRHCHERYGSDAVSNWLWELWNEPDIFYWRSTPEHYHEFYAATAAAVKSASPSAKVGGPSVTGGPDGPAFLRGFLAHCHAHDTPLDFVTFHTKGSQFTPWRTYKPPAVAAATTEKQSPSTAKMLFEIERLLDVIAASPSKAFRDLPVYITECDASVPAHWGVYDNPNFAFQNTAYYASFQASLMKKIWDLNATRDANIEAAMTWSFYFEGERVFEGTRAFITANDVEKPLLNIYRAFGRLGQRRLTATSSTAWSVADVKKAPKWSAKEEIDVLATCGDEAGSLAVMLYRHTDDQWRSDGGSAAVELKLAELSAGDRYLVTQYAIDHAHSNAHTTWQAQGSPVEPSAAQLAELRAKQGLEEVNRAVGVEVGEGGMLRLQVDMPLHSVKLLLFSLESGSNE